MAEVRMPRGTTARAHLIVAINKSARHFYLSFDTIPIPIPNS